MSFGQATMPDGVLAAAIPVLIYTTVCIACGILLVSALIAGKERYSYVLLLSGTTIATALVAVIQQVNNIINWHDLRIAKYKASLAAYENPALALGPMSYGFNAGLFWTELYLFNVVGLLVLFWAIALVANVWNWRLKSLSSYSEWTGAVSKIAAFVIPAVMEALRQVFEVNAGFIGTLVLVNILLLLSCFLGSICVALILAKYLRIRFGFHTDPSGSMPSVADSQASRSPWARLKRRIDPWLVVRFTLAWFVITGYEVFIVFFCLSRYYNVKHSKEMQRPDFTIRGGVSDILTYIPSPTATLLIFCIFGTTAQLRVRYISILGTLMCLKRERPTSSRIERHSAHEWDRVNSLEMGRTRGDVIIHDEDEIQDKEENKDSMSVYVLPHQVQQDGDGRREFVSY